MGIRSAAILAAGLIALGVAPAASEPPMRATGYAEPQLAGAHDGAYVGFMSGLSASALDAPEGPSWADTGLFGGAFIGYGRVTGGTYLGIEIDGMVRDIKPASTDGVSTVSFSNRWLASGRVRMGLPIGPALLYATGGLALQESVLKVNDPLINDSDAQMIWGAVVGAGVEVKLTHTVALRLEGRHY
ncbi:MAG: outer membrane beta-barrel protein, partial [Hyphomicrobiaceae bacterium]|nr:outer membrane beta-barrel protein [Hyphomicrobiaceae bacterium]